MKTVLFLFSIFILKCFSDPKVYLIETEDEEDKVGRPREIEAGTDYGDDGPSPYNAKPKPYEQRTTTTPKKWTTTTTKWETTTTWKAPTTTTTTLAPTTTTTWETTTTWKPKTTTTVWKEKIKCVWSSWGSWSKGIKTCEETTLVRRRDCDCRGGYGASAESYEKKNCDGKKIQARVKKVPSCYVAPKPEPSTYKKPKSYGGYKPPKPKPYGSKESYETVRSYESHSEESKE